MHFFAKNISFTFDVGNRVVLSEPGSNKSGGLAGFRIPGLPVQTLQIYVNTNLA